MNVTITLPEPDGYSDGAPFWVAPLASFFAHPEGVATDGYVEEDVDAVEAGALALLAAVHAHRAMGVTNGPASTSGHPVIGAERAAQLAGGTP